MLDSLRYAWEWWMRQDARKILAVATFGLVGLTVLAVLTASAVFITLPLAFMGWFVYGLIQVLVGLRPDSPHAYEALTTLSWWPTPALYRRLLQQRAVVAGYRLFAMVWGLAAMDIAGFALISVSR